jgi:hypothetical protein
MEVWIYFITAFLNITNLSLHIYSYKSRLNHTVVELLARFTQLQRLNLNFPLTSKVAQSIGQLSQVSSLEVDIHRISKQEDIVPHLQKLDKLKNLNLRNINQSLIPSLFPVLSQLPQLEELKYLITIQVSVVYFIQAFLNFENWILHAPRKHPMKLFCLFDAYHLH